MLHTRPQNCRQTSDLPLAACTTCAVAADRPRNDLANETFSRDALHPVGRRRAHVYRPSQRRECTRQSRKSPSTTPSCRYGKCGETMRTNATNSPTRGLICRQWRDDRGRETQKRNQRRVAIGWLHFAALTEPCDGVPFVAFHSMVHDAPIPTRLKKTLVVPIETSDGPRGSMVWIIEELAGSTATKRRRRLTRCSKISSKTEKQSISLLAS